MLEPEQRTGKLPEDTKQVPLEMWVKIHGGGAVDNHVVAGLDAHLLRLNLLGMVHLNDALAVLVAPGLHGHACRRVWIFI